MPHMPSHRAAPDAVIAPSKQSTLNSPPTLSRLQLPSVKHQKLPSNCKVNPLISSLQSPPVTSVPSSVSTPDLLSKVSNTLTKFSRNVSSPLTGLCLAKPKKPSP